MTVSAAASPPPFEAVKSTTTLETAVRSQIVDRDLIRAAERAKKTTCSRLLQSIVMFATLRVKRETLAVGGQVHGFQQHLSR